MHQTYHPLYQLHITYDFNLGTVNVAQVLLSKKGFVITPDFSTICCSITSVSFSCFLWLLSSPFSPSSSSASELIYMGTSLFLSCSSAITSTTETILSVASGTWVSFISFSLFSSNFLRLPKNYFIYFYKTTYVYSYKIRTMLNHYLPIALSNHNTRALLLVTIFAFKCTLSPFSYWTSLYFWTLFFKALFIRFELSAAIKAYRAAWRVWRLLHTVLLDTSSFHAGRLFVKTLWKLKFLTYINWLGE